jgi:hypothetical protein
MQINQPKDFKPKIKELKKWCKLVRGVKAKRCKRKGHKIRPWCTHLSSLIHA